VKIVRKEEHDALMKRAKEAEWYETPDWAAERILDVELCTPLIIDPCAGRGVLGRAARSKGYRVREFDLNVWPDTPKDAFILAPMDFLGGKMRKEIEETVDTEFTVFMNPPFSKTVEFIETSFAIGARKVIMFQRLAFLESATRRDFFDRLPPARIWLCGDRAVSWRGDIPDEDVTAQWEDENGVEKEDVIKGRKGRSTPTPHAWFVWEKSHRGLMATHHLYKEE